MVLGDLELFEGIETFSQASLLARMANLFGETKKF